MAGSKTSDGVPAKAREERVPDIYARKLTNRARALIDQAFDDLEKRATSGRGDFVKLLADQLLEDPLGSLERLNKLLPQEQAPGAAGAPGVAFNVQSMFLEATKIANGHGTAAPIIDVTPQEPAEGW